MRRRRRRQRSIPIYAMPAVIFGLGMSALILSLAWPSTDGASALPPAALVNATEPDLGAHDNPVAARARRADESDGEAEPDKEPVARAPVVVRAQGN